jgi:hypothetical protein
MNWKGFRLKRWWPNRCDYVLMALPALSMARPLIQFRTHVSQMMGLLGRRISPSQGRYLHREEHKHRINADRHKFPECDSNPRSQCPGERRQFMPLTVQTLWLVNDVISRNLPGGTEDNNEKPRLFHPTVMAVTTCQSLLVETFSQF